MTGAADPTVPMAENSGRQAASEKTGDRCSTAATAPTVTRLVWPQVLLMKSIIRIMWQRRMEIGAVMAAAPRSNVIRETSDPGDIIILLGRTYRP